MEKEPQHVHKSPEGGFFQASPKVTFYFGLMSGIAVVSIVGFLLTFSMLRDGGVTKKNSNSSGSVAGTTTNTTPTPSAAVPTAPAAKVDIAITDDDHIRGNPDAKVTLVEYSDFECPFCEAAHPTFQKILETYGDDVRMIYRHYPLSFHPQAQKAAEASECAADQDKFWEMHDKLFALNTAGTLSVDNFKKAAGELGLKQSEFDSCLDTGTNAQKVKDSLAQGTQYGVQGTPATYVNGTLVSGAVPYEQFAAVIDAELAK